MTTFDPRLQLAQGGDSTRVAVQRLSDLPLMALFELARALESGAERPDEMVEGFNLVSLRASLGDASGALQLADVRVRRAEHEPPWEGQSERDDLLEGAGKALAGGRIDEAGTLVDLALERFPGDSLTAVAGGFVRWAAGRLEEARALFLRAPQSADADPGLKADALYAQAILLAHEGQAEVAVNVLERSATIEESLPETWSRPAARARYAQARLLAQQIAAGGLGGQHLPRCRQAVLAAIEANGYFFGPAYVDPVFGVLEGLRNTLNDRFNDQAIEANLIANAGKSFTNRMQTHRLVDHERLQRAREVFDGRGFFSRSRLMAVGVRTIVRLREAAVAQISARLEAATQARDAEHSVAESVQRQGAERAQSELAQGAEATRALDMRAFSLRQTQSDRFRMDESLDPQHERLALVIGQERKGRLIWLAAIATVILAVAVVLVPTVLGKTIAAVVIVASAISWALVPERRRYDEAIEQLDRELEKARGVRATELNVSQDARRAEAQSQAQSETVRRQAEADRQVRQQRADQRHADDLYELRGRVSVLAEENARFFRGINGQALPEAAFSPPRIDAPTLDAPAAVEEGVISLR